MKNPFEYGGIVEAGAFCNRQKELADLRRVMENGEKLFLYSERRLGKTSVLKLALSRLSRKDFLCAYIDLWPTDSEPSFASAYASAITESFATGPQKMLDFAGEFFGRLVPSISLDAEGQPEMRFAVSRQISSGAALEDVLKAPQRIATKTKKQIVIVFDEFQQVLEYEDDLVERCLRSAIQQQGSVSYIFSGSRKHLIQKMVLDKSRPLYRSGGHYPLGPIADRHWLAFVGERFEQSGRRISEEQILAICKHTEGHPFYTQHLCHALWELTEPNSDVTESLLEEAIAVVLQREDYAYTAIWGSLALNQRRLLEGLAMDEPGVKPYSADFVERYELRTPSNVQRAAKALLEKDLIDQEEGSFYIVDRFFRLWIQKKHD